MARCCYEPCPSDATVHIFAGPMVVRSSEPSYTGASYCSWEHLAADMHRLPTNFHQVPICASYGLRDHTEFRPMLREMVEYALKATE